MLAGGTMTPWLNSTAYVKYLVKGDYFGKGRDSTMARMRLRPASG